MTTGEEFSRIAGQPQRGLVSEEDVKNKVVLPMLKALGYSDSDFNYERRTGRGYVDIVVEHFPAGIVVETKAPRVRLENHIGQLESYVFHKHSRDRTTIAILTDGNIFHIFAVTDALWRGSLAENKLETFSLADLVNPELVARLSDLLSRAQNQKGAIPDVITARRKELIEMRDRLKTIETEVTALLAERQRIDARLNQLQSERSALLGEPVGAQALGMTTARSQERSKFAACPHILRLLTQRQANSKVRAIERSWLDEQLVGKVDGIGTQQAVSFGLIELKKSEKIDYEKRAGTIRDVWLT